MTYGEKLGGFTGGWIIETARVLVAKKIEEAEEHNISLDVAEGLALIEARNAAQEKNMSPADTERFIKAVKAEFAKRKSVKISWPRPEDVAPEKRIVMLISGGESAGVNNYFALLARKAAAFGYSVEVIKYGLDSLVKGPEDFAKNKFWINEAASNLIANMPGAVFGTARVNIDDETMPHIMANLKGYCGTVVIIGGNDHTGQAAKLAKGCKEKGVPIAVIALPKTIDYDTVPYPIGARTAGENAREMVLRAMPQPGSGKCVVFQAMGRNMGYLATAAGDINDPRVVIATPEWHASLQTIVDAVKARMKKYGAAALVVSEGFSVSKDDAVLRSILEKHPRLKYKYDMVIESKKTDIHGNPVLSELGVADFVAEALIMDTSLGLERDKNLFVEDSGYSYRCTSPNGLDRAVAEDATTLAAKMIEDRKEIIRRGGVCIAADRQIRSEEDLAPEKMPVRARSFEESLGTTDLKTSGIYTEDELGSMPIIGRNIKTGKEELPNLAAEEAVSTGKIDVPFGLKLISSQSESSKDMKRPNICVIARDDADELILALQRAISGKAQDTLSPDVAYVIGRTNSGIITYRSDEYVPLGEIVEKASQVLETNKMLNVVLPANFPVHKDDKMLKLLCDEDPSFKAIVDKAIANSKGDGNLTFGRRLVDILYMALTIEKKMKGIRKNILGESLNMLPEERPEQAKAVSTTPAKGIERILIVDDEPGIVDLVVRIIKKWNVHVSVETAITGTAGLQKYNDAKASGMPFDLVFVDMVMPDKKGAAIAREVNKEVPVIMITAGQITEKDMREATAVLEEGFVTEKINKPFYVQSLVDTLDRAAENIKKTGGKQGPAPFSGGVSMYTIAKYAIRTFDRTQTLSPADIGIVQAQFPLAHIKDGISPLDALREEIARQRDEDTAAAIMAYFVEKRLPAQISSKRPESREEIRKALSAILNNYSEIRIYTQNQINRMASLVSGADTPWDDRDRSFAIDMLQRYEHAKDMTTEEYKKFHADVIAWIEEAKSQGAIDGRLQDLLLQAETGFLTVTQLDFACWYLREIEYKKSIAPLIEEARSIITDYEGMGRFTTLREYMALKKANDPYSLKMAITAVKQKHEAWTSGNYSVDCLPREARILVNSVIDSRRLTDRPVTQEEFDKFCKKAIGSTAGKVSDYIKGRFRRRLGEERGNPRFDMIVDRGKIETAFRDVELLAEYQQKHPEKKIGPSPWEGGIPVNQIAKNLIETYKSQGGKLAGLDIQHTLENLEANKAACAAIGKTPQQALEEELTKNIKKEDVSAIIKYLRIAAQEAVITDVKNLTRQMAAHKVLRTEGAIDLSNMVIVMKKGMMETTPDVQKHYKVMKQGLRKLFNNGEGIIEVATSEELVSKVEMLASRGLKAIVLDDGTLTQDITKDKIQAKAGEDYCMISIESLKDLGPMDLPFVNLNAMAMMGVGILYHDSILFGRAYQAFKGVSAPKDLLDAVSKKVFWIIKVLPRIVKFDLKYNDEQNRLKSLFDVAA
ncbi:MAG: 6-phosphofructokinase [Candidatus Omnitrophica bacterium]|nr:6-phosphofructokinase [Candidatus Omnitrophota bacterium]